jgi:hypothetical protein
MCSSSEALGSSYRLSLECTAQRAYADACGGLLKAGVVILEGVDMRSVAPGYYDLACLKMHRSTAGREPANR